MQNQASILFVHAHPDDESINNAATMAKYAAAGARVTLVTCTAGEEGEVVVEDLRHLAADRENRLGEHRQVELAEAMAALGVTDHRFLGGFGRFRDSGMMGTPENARPECFWRTDLLEAARALVEVIREVRPQVLVTYDDFGGYGHPDHIQAHRVAMYAAQLAAAPSFQPQLPAWSISKIYWNAMPRGRMRTQMSMLQAQGIDTGFDLETIDSLPFLCDDELVTTEIDGSEFADHKWAALAAHRSQLDVNDGYFRTLREMGSTAMATEFYRLVGGSAFTGAAAGGERDLLAGI